MRPWFGSFGLETWPPFVSRFFHLGHTIRLSLRLVVSRLWDTHAHPWYPMEAMRYGMTDMESNHSWRRISETSNIRRRLQCYEWKPYLSDIRKQDIKHSSITSFLLPEFELLA